MTDVETWVCALCKQYDPVLPDDMRANAPQTEWVGCDCNRWFHQYCTKLQKVDDSFSCKMVNLQCLPGSK
jgi:rubredoxin